MQEQTVQTIYKAMQVTINEIGKVIIGKDEVVRKLLMSILAGGHILLDDVPGVGKTSLAVSLERTLGLKYNRIQFTPDVLPSDIVGFSIFNKETEKFIYMPGVVNNTNLLLADEINRTSSRTQAALLEAMEEKQVTVDGNVYKLPDPFIVIATQNQVGTAGTQMLPHAQLDRFLVRLSIGYPDMDSEMQIVRERQTADPYAGIKQILNTELLREMQAATLEVTLNDEVLKYIALLVRATRNDPMIELGISPRGTIAVSHMAKARAIIEGRDYVTTDDVKDIFADVCTHRILLSQKARAEHLTAEDVISRIVGSGIVPFSIVL